MFFVFVSLFTMCQSEYVTIEQEVNPVQKEINLDYSTKLTIHDLEENPNEQKLFSNSGIETLFKDINTKIEVIEHRVSTLEDNQHKKKFSKICEKFCKMILKFFLSDK